MESVDIVQAGYAAFGAGDMPGLLALCDPAVEWVYYGAVPWAGEYGGHDAVTRFFSILGETLAFEAFEPREFIVDVSHVAVLGRTVARVRRSGAAFDNHWAHVFTIRGGRIVRFIGYDTTGVH